jgi:hypothetical protein
MTDITHSYQLMHKALDELLPEIEDAKIKPLPLAPPLRDTLDEVGPLPRESLFLGLATDGFPVLLDLHDPTPGPLLIAGDPGSGKTAMLQMIVQAGMRTHSERMLQFAVISNYPDEWDAFSGRAHAMGIFPTYHDSAMEFLRSLSGWAHENRRDRKSILLLIDDLESMEHLDFEYQQILRWLLFRGPARRVWPMLTLNAERYHLVQSWLESFRTRIFGTIKNDQVATNLAGIPSTSFSWMHQGLQFAIRENGGWLKFWIPEI